MDQDPWDEEVNPREAAVHFEAVKIAMNQNKDGMILKLVIQPNDIPDSLMRDWVGSRYTVAMVKMDDHDQPVMPEQKKQVDAALRISGTICRNGQFWKYIENVMDDGRTVDDEASAAVALREFLGVESRSEIAKDPKVKDRFMGMVGEFEEWVRS